MKSLPKTILDVALSLPEGGTVSPREFLHLGSRAAVDQAFSRLSKAGELLRVGRGVYAAPVSGSYGKRAPSPEKVLHALEAQTGVAFVPHGATEANRLGLTTQMPIRKVYLSSGPRRVLSFGKNNVQVEHVPPASFFLRKEEAAAAARAIEWLGPVAAPNALRTLHQTLSPSAWAALVSARRRFPAWMSKAVSLEMGCAA